MSIQEIKKALSKTFQGMLKNIVSLANDSTLEKDFKVLKVGDKNTPIQLSETKVKVNNAEVLTTDTNTFSSESDDITLNADGNIYFNADSGNIYIKDDAQLHFEFDCDNTHFRIYDDSTSPTDSDHFTIAVGGSGATTLTSIDAGGITENAHVTIDAEGVINLDAHSNGYINIKKDGTIYGYFGVHHSASNLRLYENGGASTDDYFNIATQANGKTVITTVDDGGATAHLIFAPDGGVMITEKAAAAADVAGEGQLWVKDTTPNTLYFVNDAGGETELTNNVRTSVVDFDTADMNDLHNTAIELVAAQGVSHVIIPIKITAFVNRSASTTQAVAKDLMYGYNGAVVVGQGVWAYHRRFMYNEGGDRVLCPFELAEIAQDDGDAIDRPLTAKMTAAITTDSIDSMRVITQYYVADLS